MPDEVELMWKVGLLGILPMFPASLAASEFDREVQSGRRALMRSYGNFNIADCSGYRGTVTVVTKPSNGLLATRSGPYVIDINRFTGTRSKCAGRTIPGLHVYYTSRPGFRGVDRFTLRAVYREGLLSVNDNYSVSVR
jgi:hypothetical protein